MSNRHREDHKRTIVIRIRPGRKVLVVATRKRRRHRRDFC